MMAKGPMHPRYRHGLTRTPAWNVWASMMNRCYCPTTKVYKEYGGRGITVDDHWHMFENFFSDMGAPSEGLTLERVDNDGPYCATNCRWATHTEQCRNRRSTRWETLNGKT